MNTTDFRIMNSICTYIIYMSIEYEIYRETEEHIDLMNWFYYKTLHAT